MGKRNHQLDKRRRLPFASKALLIGAVMALIALTAVNLSVISLQTAPSQVPEAALYFSRKAVQRATESDETETALYSSRRVVQRATASHETMSSCMLIMDDNHWLVEWLAYHWTTLNLRNMIIAIGKWLLITIRHVPLKLLIASMLFVEFCGKIHEVKLLQSPSWIVGRIVYTLNSGMIVTILIITTQVTMQICKKWISLDNKHFLQSVCLHSNNATIRGSCLPIQMNSSRSILVLIEESMHCIDNTLPLWIKLDLYCRFFNTKARLVVRLAFPWDDYSLVLMNPLWKRFKRTSHYSWMRPTF